MGAGTNAHESEIIKIYQKLIDVDYAARLPAQTRYREKPLRTTTIAAVCSGPLTDIRTPATAALLPAGYCSFIALQAGEGLWLDRHRHVALRPGEVLFIEAARPFTIHFNSAYRALSFNVPRAQLLSTMKPLPRHGHRANASRLDRQQFLQLLEDAHAGAPSPIAAEQQLLKRCRGLFPPLALDDRRRLGAVKALIQRHAADEDFCIAQLSALSGISRRHLYTLFDQESLSLKRYIHHTRLINAFRQLADADFCHLSIHDIALDCGFKTQAHFSRLFRQHFAITPKQVRRVLNDTVSMLADPV